MAQADDDFGFNSEPEGMDLSFSSEAEIAPEKVSNSDFESDDGDDAPDSTEITRPTRGVENVGLGTSDSAAGAAQSTFPSGEVEKAVTANPAMAAELVKTG